jgi:hypothetical protein
MTEEDISKNLSRVSKWPAAERHSCPSSLTSPMPVPDLKLRAEHQQAQFQVERLNEAISVIEGLVTASSDTSANGALPRRTVSAATRRRMVQAQRARWSKVGKDHNQYRQEKRAARFPSALCQLPLGGRSQRHNGKGGQNLEHRTRRLRKKWSITDQRPSNRWRAFIFGPGLIALFWLLCHSRRARELQRGQKFRQRERFCQEKS